MFKVGILTVRDRCSKGMREDKSGEAIQGMMAIMKKVLRWLLASVLFFVIGQFIAMGVYGGLFPNYYQGYEAFRPMSSLHFRFGLPLMGLIQAMVISLLYAVFYKGIIGVGILKGIVFGSLLWLMTGCGIVITYCTTVMPFPVPCLVQTIVSMIIGGLVISAVYGKVLEEKEG